MFDVVGAKYLYALENGEVFLLFLFSGTILYAPEGRELEIAQVDLAVGGESDGSDAGALDG